MELGTRQINELHVEAGAKLNASLLRSGLVDEMLIYMAPCLLGPGEGIADLPALSSLEQRIPMRFSDIEQIGPDLRILAQLGDLAWTKEK